MPIEKLTLLHSNDMHGDFLAEVRTAVNAGVRAVYDNAARQLVSLTLQGEPVEDTKVYSVCVTGYHLRSSADFLNITYEELAEIPRPRTVATSMQDVLEEYLRNNQNIGRKVEGRLVYL